MTTTENSTNHTTSNGRRKVLVPISAIAPYAEYVWCEVSSDHGDGHLVVRAPGPGNRTCYAVIRAACVQAQHNGR
jgi:hypothetical protein